jgi:hypothetical protein
MNKESVGFQKNFLLESTSSPLMNLGGGLGLFSDR